MRCPQCNGPLRRLDTSSEPEGIRRDAECTHCSARWMVTKANFVIISAGAVADPVPHHNID